jgi:quaternary ammonium compound-resistance protein SugE
MFAFLYNPGVAWILVGVAAVIETAWFLVLKQSSGLQAWPWNLIGYAMVFLDIPLLSIALKTLPTGSVYAFWTGASAVAIALIGIWLFKEPATFWRLFFIAVVVVGVIGINLTS